MSYQNGRSFTSRRGLHLTAGNGCIKFDTPTVTPTTTSGEYLLYVNSSNALVFDNGSSVTTIGAAGGGASVPQWESIFAGDYTFTLTPDATFTIAGNTASATDVLTLTNIGGSSGDVIQITNSGTGSDIKGTSDTWSVSKAGAAVFVGVTPGGDITSTAVAVDWDLQDNVASALSFDSAGQAGILEIVTTDGSESVNMATACAVTGALTALGASNTVSNVVVTNNTATTFGADADSSGVVVIRSTSLTTGALLQLQATEGTLAGGFYIVGRDVTAGGNVYTVGEDGATVIAGAGGSNMLTVTAGDTVISDGSLTITDADNAATVDVTNNTITTGNQIINVDSTSITTGAMMTLNANAATHDGEILELISAGDTTSTPTGLSIVIASPTTGAATGIAVTMAAATTTAKGIAVTMDALTTGDMLYLDNGGGTMTGDGKFINCNDDNTDVFSVSASGATVLTGALNAVSLTVTNNTATTANSIVDFSSTSITTGALLRLDANTAAHDGEVLEIISGGDATSTPVGMSVTIASPTTGAARGIEVTMVGATTTAKGIAITMDALTTGDMLYLDNGGGTLTGDGKFINCNDDDTTLFAVGPLGTLIHRDFTEVVTAANVITSEESGSVFFLNSATEFASTLPAPAAGLHYTFIVTAAPSGAAYTVGSNGAAQVIFGTVHSSDGADGDSEVSGGATSINFVDGAAVIGDRVEVWCDGTNWHCVAHCDVSTGITYTG